jgi:hypothetical protein
MKIQSLDKDKYFFWRSFLDFTLSLKKQFMKPGIIIATLLSILLFACGNKKNPGIKDPSDSIQTKKEVGLNNPKKQDSIKKETVIIDSTEITTNTEVLNEKGQLDPNSSPIAVVQTIIKAAKTGNYTPLMKLSNPAVSMDGDARDVINIANASDEAKKEFKDFFGKATIIGKARINKNLAEVDIKLVGQNREKETINVENKFDKWYLKSF